MKIRSALVSIVVAMLITGTVSGQIPSGSGRFDDVPSGHWAEDAIGWAAENGITSGTGPRLFSPDGTVTRAQMVTFLYRLAQLRQHPSTLPPTEGSVLFSAGPRDHPTGLYVANPSHRTVAQISDTDADKDYASWAPNGEYVLFQDTTRDAVYAVEPDGQGEYRIVGDQVSAREAAWSPNGKYVLIRMTDDELDGFVYYVTTVDRQAGFKLFTPPSLTASQGVWSPNSDRFAYMARPAGSDDGRSLYITDLGNGVPRRVASSVGSVVDVAWSPSGDRLLIRSSEHPDNDGLYVVNVDGTDLLRVTPETLDVGAGWWSPNRDRVVYTTKVGEQDLYTVKPDGTDHRLLVEGVADYTYPQWSPDGTRVAVVGEPDDVFAVLIINPDDGSEVRLSGPDQRTYSPVWSPDSSQLSYVGAPSEGWIANQLFVADRDGGNPRQVSDTPTRVNHMAWSADSNRIVYSDGWWGQYGVHVVNTDGTGRWDIPTNSDYSVGGLSWVPHQPPFSKGSDAFSDIPRGHWADQAVGWAVSNGITSGVGNDRFDPDGTVTRAQIGAFLHRVALFMGGSAVNATTTGEGIIFSATTGGLSELSLYVSDSAGAQPHRLDIAPPVVTAAWSPNGEQVAFARSDGDTLSIWVMNADGTAQRQLTNTDDGDISPAWSPNGEQVAFARSDGDSLSIWVMNADGTAHRQLTNTDDGDISPAWSPNGEQVAFARSDGDSASIWVMNADGTAQRQLTDDDDISPAWSPNGEQVAFARSDGDTASIWVMNADGTAQRQLTDDDDDISPAWSPNGEQVAFARSDGDTASIWVMNADGTAQRQIVAGLSLFFLTSQAWTSAGVVPARGSLMFDDVPPQHWADLAVGWAVARNIMTHAQLFGLDSTVTRAEMVSFLRRTDGLLERVAGSR